MTKRGNFILLISIIIFFSLSYIVTPYSSWTRTGYDLNRTHFNPGVGEITNPRIIWNYSYSASTSSYLHTPPMVDDINDDGIYEVCISAKDEYLRCFNALNGTPVWTFNTFNVQPTPATSLITDLEGDGKKELIIGSDEGTWFIVNGTDGTGILNVTDTGEISGTPIAYDFIGDSNKEILIKSEEGMFAYYANGSLIWNNTEVNPGKLIGYEPSLVDINLDGVMDIVAGFDNNVTILNITNGSLIQLINLVPTPSNDRAYGVPSVSIVDFNEDSFPDMIASSHNGRVYGINNSGNVVWNYTSTYYFDDEVAIADIDNDGLPEVVSSSYDNAITAINAEDGSILWKNYWKGSSTSSPTIADIDNDGDLEVLESDSGHLCIYNGRYGYAENCISIATISHHSPPTLADVDNDGFLEIFVSGRDFHNSYPIEYENKLVAIDSGGPSRPTSHKEQDIENSNSVDWKIEGKNTLKNYNIDDYISSTTISTVTNLSNVSASINYSIVSSDIDGDGNWDIVFGNGSAVYCLYQNGSEKWNYNFNKYIMSSPLISDYDDDTKDEIIVITTDTLFILNSSGSLEMDYTHSSSDLNYQVLSLDFDGDQETEIFYTFRQRYSKTILMESNESVIFSDQYTGGGLVEEIGSVVDLNKDGILDLILFAIGGVRVTDGYHNGIIASQMVNGRVVQGTVSDLNNDGYYDVILGTTNSTKTSSFSGYSDLKHSYGNFSGAYAYAFNISSNTFYHLWNYSTQNVTSKITSADIDSDGYNEVIFGDLDNNLFVINSTGSQLWNLTLHGKIEYPSLVLESSDLIISTTNQSLYLIDSSGNVLYNFNNTVEFGYSPIIMDIDGDSKGELLIGDVSGILRVFDFNAPSSNQISGSFIFYFGGRSYTLSEKGYGKIGSNVINIKQHSQSKTQFSIEGTGSIPIELTGMSPQTKYKIVDQHSISEESFATSDTSGLLSFTANLGSLHDFTITPYTSTTRRRSGCLFDFDIINEEITFEKENLIVDFTIENKGNCGILNLNVSLISSFDTLSKIITLNMDKKEKLNFITKLPEYPEENYELLIQAKVYGKSKEKIINVDLSKKEIIKQDKKEKFIINNFITIFLILIIIFLIYKILKKHKTNLP